MDMDVDTTLAKSAMAATASEPSSTADSSGVAPMIASVEVSADATAEDVVDGRVESRYARMWLGLSCVHVNSLTAHPARCTHDFHDDIYVFPFVASNGE